MTQPVADAADRTVAILDGRTSAERVRVNRDARRGGIELSDAPGLRGHWGSTLALRKEFLLTLGIEDRAVIGLEDG